MKKFVFILSFCLYLILLFAFSNAKEKKFIETNSGQIIRLKSLKHLKSKDIQNSNLNLNLKFPVVYWTRDINSKSILNIYKKLNFKPVGKVGLKISMGESLKSNYLRPELLKDLVRELNANIVDCNTAIGGNRINTKNHIKIAKEHGFIDITNVDILDSEGDMSIPIRKGLLLKENFVGTHFRIYGSYVVLSHFNGNKITGFGGAIKNTSLGFASSMGKRLIYTGGKNRLNIVDTNQKELFEAMTDALKSVIDYMNNGKNIIYINVMNNLSIDCDCVSDPESPKIQDIGILASNDPVALDQACLDIIEVVKGNKMFLSRLKEKNAMNIIEIAKNNGIGQNHYFLVDIN